MKLGLDRRHMRWGGCTLHRDDESKDGTRSVEFHVTRACSRVGVRERVRGRGLIVGSGE